MPRSNRIPRAPAGKRRLYDWEGGTSSSLALASVAGTQATLFTADAAETIVRVRGQILVQLNTGSVEGDSAVVAAGLIVASTGSTIAVDPFTEAGANWLWHQFIIVHTEGIVGGVAEQGDMSGALVTIDNKSMRKIREDEVIQLMIFNGNVAGAPQVDVVTAVRVLTQS